MNDAERFSQNGMLHNCPCIVSYKVTTRMRMCKLRSLGVKSSNYLTGLAFVCTACEAGTLRDQCFVFFAYSLHEFVGVMYSLICTPFEP
jgi:hypothetical protein